MPAPNPAPNPTRGPAHLADSRTYPSLRRFRSASLSDHVRRVLVVLFADAFDEIGIRYQAPGQLDGPRLRVRLRIVDRDLDVHMPDLRPGKTFGDPQRFGPR